MRQMDNGVVISKVGKIQKGSCYFQSVIKKGFIEIGVFIKIYFWISVILEFIMYECQFEIIIICIEVIGVCRVICISEFFINNYDV